MITRKHPWLFPVSDLKFIRVYDPSSFRQANITYNSWPRPNGPIKPAVIPHFSVLPANLSKITMASYQIDQAQHYIYVGDISQAAAIISTVENQLKSDEMLHTPENVKLLFVKGMLQQCQKEDSDAVSSFEKSLQLQIQVSGKGQLHHSCWFAYKCLAFAYMCVEQFDKAGHIFLNHNIVVPPIHNFLTKKQLWQEGLTAYALTQMMQGDLENGVQLLKTELCGLANTNHSSFATKLINYNLSVALGQSISELPEQALVDLGLEDLISDDPTFKLCSH